MTSFNFIITFLGRHMENWLHPPSHYNFLWVKSPIWNYVVLTTLIQSRHPKADSNHSAQRFLWACFWPLWLPSASGGLDSSYQIPSPGSDEFHHGVTGHGCQKTFATGCKTPCVPLTSERWITLILHLHTRGKKRNSVKTVCATRRCHSILIWSIAKLSILGPHVGPERRVFPPRLHVLIITEIKSRMTDMRFLWFYDAALLIWVHTCITGALDEFMFFLTDTGTGWLVGLTASPSLQCTQTFMQRWYFQRWPPKGTLHSTAAGTSLPCRTAVLKSQSNLSELKRCFAQH